MGKVYFIADENEDVVGISEALKEKGYSVSHKIALVGELIQNPILYRAKVTDGVNVRDENGDLIIENEKVLVLQPGTMVDIYGDHLTFGGLLERAAIVPLNVKPLQNVWMRNLLRV